MIHTVYDELILIGMVLVVLGTVMAFLKEYFTTELDETFMQFDKNGKAYYD